ncbi:hypothetical protein GWK08_02285 [Leptobacterium flavescens]|uniref:Tetratricopeptide repeat protein n=1 Tax=Leptobacterium flavescens TaxID=472055 RepID=A0A6P0UK66_9FLAO|nr:hypothetical protein [Leptobacterium flavescens]NER12259.1 hypothetical protein [Leptobacterium flavescens]
MKKFISLSIVFLLFLFSCSGEKKNNRLNYSTSSDTAMEYYNLGWQQIMDEGRYGQAEQSYRKALQADPSFLIGQSVLARLTTDLNERLELYKNLEEKKENISGDERQVLDVYIALTKFTNLREQKDPKAGDALQQALTLAEKNLRQIVHKYPEEVYLKAEYLEVLHSVHGAEASLDTLARIVSKEQQDNPFILGYRAGMQAETGNFSEALGMAARLRELVGDSKLPKPDAVYADIYFKMDSLRKAKMHADRAYRLDPRNLDASRLKTRIDTKLQSQKEEKD